jgi:hypothetical protein
VIHEGASAERLAAARIVVFGAWLVVLLRTPPAPLTELPSSLVVAPGLAGAIPGVDAVLGSATALRALWLLAVLGSVLCVVGVRPWRGLATPTVLLLVWHDIAMKSLGGYVNHAQIAILLAAAVLALSPAADAVSPGRRRAEHGGDRWRYGGPLALMAFLLALAYTLIGLRRLVWGGWTLFTDGSVARWVVARSLEYDNLYRFRVGVELADVPAIAWLLAVGMLIVTVLEALSLLALRSTRFRRVWLLVVAPFHVSTLVLMNIFFWENLLLLAVLFVAPRRATRGRLVGTDDPDGTGRTNPTVDGPATPDRATVGAPPVHTGPGELGRRAGWGRSSSRG